MCSIHKKQSKKNSLFKTRPIPNYQNGKEIQKLL